MENLAWKATWLSLACALECLWDYIEGVTQLVKQIHLLIIYAQSNISDCFYILWGKSNIALFPEKNFFFKKHTLLPVCSI